MLTATIKKKEREIWKFQVAVASYRYRHHKLTCASRVWGNFWRRTDREEWGAILPLAGFASSSWHLRHHNFPTTTATAEKSHLKSEFALLQTVSRLFQLVQFVKCWQIFLELNSKRLHQSSGKENESRCLAFTSSTKREIRHFHVVVVQRRLRKVQKIVMHRQSCFANLNLLLFCYSRCRCRRLRVAFK